MIGLAVLVVLLVGSIYIILSSNASSGASSTSIGDTTTSGSVPVVPPSGVTIPVVQKPVSTPVVAQPSVTPTAPSGYTMAQVKAHATASSCWTAVNGKVYDVTSWISQHPGGAGAIISMCGIDGSSAFNGQHGGQRRPATELASFLLGPLTQ